MRCVKSGLKSACPAHDLKMQNPELALLMTSQAADTCYDAIEMPPKVRQPGGKVGNPLVSTRKRSRR